MTLPVTPVQAVQQVQTDVQSQYQPSYQQFDMNSYNQQMSAATQQTNALAAALDNLEQKMTSLRQNAGQKLINIGIGTGAGITGTIALAADYQKQLSTLNATAAVTPMNMTAVKRSIENTFTSMPVSRSDVIALTGALTSLGVTGSRNIASLTQTIVKLHEATGEDMGGLAQGVVQLSRMMGTTDGSKIAGYANALLTVSKNAGVSATGVLSFSQAIAPVARAAGIAEPAVLGISAAFQKAGADGYYAGNTFNQIVGDITNLVQTGSPQLVKYASFLGMTVKQFKALPSQDQITGIFAAIAKGGPKAVDFVNELGLGTRAMTSVQAVAQSGGLQSAIHQAVRSSGNTKNLDAASKAATGGLIDGLTEFRNQFTELLSNIGQDFLPMITGVIHGLTNFAHVVESVAKPFTPLISALSATVGLLASLGGGALLAAPLLAKLIAVGFVGRSSPIAAFRGGRAYARTGEANYWSERAASEQGLRGYQTPFYAWGGKSGEAAKARDAAMAAENEARIARGLEPVSGPGMVSRVAAYPVRGANWLIQGQTDYVRSAGMPAEQRPPGMIGWVSDKTGQARRWVTGADSAAPTGGYIGRHSPEFIAAPGAAGQSGAAEQVVKAEQQVAAASEKLAAAEEECAKVATGSAEAQQKAAVGFAAASKEFIVSLMTLQKEMVASGAKIAAAGTMAGAGALAGGGLPGVAGAEAGIGARMMGGLRTAGSKLGGALMSPWALAAMIGGPMIFSGISSLAHEKPLSVPNDEGSYLNPIKQLNDQLGIATSKLVSFGSALDHNKPGGPTAPSNQANMKAALTITPEEASRYQGKGATKDNTLNTLTGTYGYYRARGVTSTGHGAIVNWQHAGFSFKNKQDAAALLSTYDMTDPRQVAQAGDDLLQLGYKPADVEGILHQAVHQAGHPAYGQVGRMAYQADVAYGGRQSTAPSGQVIRGSSSQASKRLLDAALTGLGRQTDADAASHSGAYTNARQLRTLAQILTVPLQHVTGQRSSASTNPAVAAVARAVATVTGTKAQDYYTEHGNIYSLRTSNTGLQGIVDLFRRSQAGRAMLHTAGILPGTTVTPAMLNELITTTAGQPSAQSTTNLGTGQLATAISGGHAFQLAAYGGQSGTYSTVQKAVEQTATSAQELTGGYGAAAANLQKLADATGGSAATILNAASQWARTLQQFHVQTLSREGQLGSAYRMMEGDRRVAMRPGASEAAVNQYKSDVTGFNQQKESYRQYLISTYQQAQQFGVQQVRQQEDYDTQLHRAKRDFYISMERAQQDYQRQTFRAEQDFRIQQTHQVQQQAQSVFDPYTRVTGKYTASGHTLEENLTNQNELLRRQKSELDALHNAGLSTEAIQTLDLANPNNAQQLDRLVYDIKDDPSIIARLNAMTAKRIKLTRNLTQNDYNLQFAQTNQDFTRGLKRAGQDYARQQERAREDQRRSLHDMAFDYNRMVDRSAQDLTIAMTQLYGDYAKNYTRTLDEINNSIMKYAPKIGRTLKREIQSATRTVNSAIIGGQAGETGINPAGQVGHYDQQGKWHPFRGYVNPAEAATLPHLSRPVHLHHAMGGISTFAHDASISEGNRPEAIIPLDDRGAKFMATFAGQVSQAMLRGIQGMTNPLRPMGTGGGNTTYSMDQSTHIDGPITVQAQDPDKMLKELQAKKRLAQLASPRRHS